MNLNMASATAKLNLMFDFPSPQNRFQTWSVLYPREAVMVNLHYSQLSHGDIMP